MKKISFFVFFILLEFEFANCYLKRPKRQLRKVVPISRPRNSAGDKTIGAKTAGGKKSKEAENGLDSTMETSTTAATKITLQTRPTLAPFDGAMVTPKPPKESTGQESKPPAANERKPWHEETLIYSLLYGKRPENHYRSSVRPIDMATSMERLTDSDFANKTDFVNAQCLHYTLEHKRNQLKGWDAFNGEQCESVLEKMLRRVFVKLITVFSLVFKCVP